ncbi:MAG: SH3 domain-containing protein, partial [Cyanobacteria bacterium P01_D01_bin.56]
AQCPQATWTNGYRIGELISLHSSQYKPAVVSRDLSRVRAGAGFSSRIIFTMNPGEQVTVTGEAWDIGCNQWMQVIVGEGSYWIHADNLRLLRS